MTQQSTPGAGWYPDPSNANRERWWSGDDWSAKVRPVGGATDWGNAGVATGLPQQTNGFAIASMVLGIVGGCVAIGPILSIIFGVVALNQIKSSQGRMTGRGMAIAGIVLGIVWIVILIAYIVFIVALANSSNSY